MSKTGMERLQELKKDIFKCIHCKACRYAYSGDPSRKGIGEFKGKQQTVLYEGMLDACPAGIEYGWEAFWNAGKMWIARCILNDELEFSEEVRDVIMPCITCGQCSAQCENKIRTVDIIEALRAACKEAGVPMIERHQLVERLTKELNNPYGGKAEERFKWAKDAGLEKYIDNKDAQVGYFVGCTASYRQTNIAIATCKILEQLGVNFKLVGDEVCCGSPFFRVGAVDTAQELMNKNLEAFKGLDLVFFSCAGCYKTISNDYPKWMEGELSFKTMHAFELVSRLISAEKIKFKPNKELKGKVVTYHDPCHLGRHIALEIEQKIIEESKNLMTDSRKIRQQIAEWYEVPRIILKQLEQDVGIKFKEMYRIKLDSFCCGAGGGVRAGYAEFSLKTSSLRLDEANAVGAEIITTECPFCWRNLTDANEQYEHGLMVYGLLEMIDIFKLLEIKENTSLEEILKMKE
jgi:heterodisulfide reductase subunit D